jgi:hypothetical protein
MKILDRFCAGLVALLALCISVLIPRTYPGRIWIFGTDLAVLFAAMLNWQRMQNSGNRTVQMFSIVANAAMSVFFLVLMVSIGLIHTRANLELPVAAALFLLLTVFSLRSTW